MDAKYYQDKYKRENAGNVDKRFKKQESDFYTLVFGIFLACVLFFGAVGVFAHYDAKQRRANADSCENIGGKYMVVEKSGKTQIWGCVK